MTTPDAALNDELLQATVDEDVQEAEKSQPKRNSKDDLIAKIINCCADTNLELEYSNTRLRRMTKDQLCKILAEKIELGIKSQMAAQVGAKPGAADSVIALGALKVRNHKPSKVGGERCTSPPPLGFSSSDPEI